MLLKKSWKHEITDVDGNGILFGIKIFNYLWTDTGEKATVVDPKYHQTYIFNIYTIDIDGISKRFAAGEFSNCVWGFYLEK